MPIDVERARGAERHPSTLEWDDQDVLLYHLSLGAGDPPTSAAQLAWAYEDGLQVLPTFPVVAGARGAAGGGGLNDLPGVDIDMHAVLHGEQEVEVHRPIPVRGTARAVGRVADVWDKGKAAVLRLETDVTDPDGSPLWTSRSSIFVRGEGGFGGDRGPSSGNVPPERPPDRVVDTPTLPQQALLYRLNGDRNPLHADPGFARLAGFEQPILHGLCTYGMVCRAVIDDHLGGDASAVARFTARFGGVVLPGETLRTELWEEQGRLLVRTSVLDRDTTALTNAAIDLR